MREPGSMIFIKNDIGKGLLYQTDLKPITNYKLDELKIIAERNDISLKNNGKNRTKRELYDLVYIKMIQ